MKKTISTILVIVILCNFIFCRMPVFAVDEDGPGDTKMSDVYVNDSAQPSNEITAQILEEGKVSRTTGGGDKVETSHQNFGSSIIGMILGILALLVDLLAFQVDLIMAQLTYSTENGSLNYFLSIDKIVFNRVPLFNINYFNTEDTYTVGDLEIDASQSVNDIKDTVAAMFYSCRLIALSMALIVLIYIGIRMAISTIASEEAKYKKMLVSWVESIVLLFMMTYIMSIMMYFGEVLIGMFYKIRCQIIEAGDQSFEEKIKEGMFNSLFNLSGISLAMYSLMYWFLLYSQIKFFWVYIKRVLMVGFLIMISPIITVTYAIDKVGDGQAQAFSIWFKEFTVNVLIQPLHALIYLVFMFTAGEIAERAPLLAIAFLMSLGSVERMVKVIFDMRGLVTLRGVDKLLKKG